MTAMPRPVLGPGGPQLSQYEPPKPD